MRSFFDYLKRNHLVIAGLIIALLGLPLLNSFYAKKEGRKIAVVPSQIVSFTDRILPDQKLPFVFSHYSGDIKNLEIFYFFLINNSDSVIEASDFIDAISVTYYKPQDMSF